MREPPRTPPEVANVLRRLLRENRVSETRMSLDLDRGKSWLSDLLRGRYPLTLEAAEWIGECFDVTLEWIFQEAYPPEERKPPERLLGEMAPKTPEGSLTANAKRIESLVAYEPTVDQLDDFDGSAVTELMDQIWEDRKGAFDFAIFHIDGLLKPRKLYTFVAALGTLSELLRATRAYDNYFRAQALLRSYELVDRFPQPVVRAFLDERTAYLLWNLAPSNPRLVSALLERESLIDHPFTDRLFAARANFQLLSGRPRRALAYCEMVFRLADSQVARASAFSTAASALLRMGDPLSALVHIKEALKESNLARVIQLNLRAQKGTILLEQGDTETAHSLLSEVLMDDYYCSVWPDKAAYAARDLFNSDPCAEMQEALVPRVNLILSKLNPANAVEAASLRELSALVATTADASHITRIVDPNG